MEEGYFRPWGSETPEPIHLKIGTFDYVQRLTPHAKYGARGTAVGWGGERGEFVPSRAFWFLQRIYSLHREAWIFTQCTKMCFDRWWVCSFGSVCPGG